MKTHISLLILSFFSITVLKAQEKSKDTIFFKLDNRYVYESEVSPNHYFLKDHNNDEAFFFKGIEIVNNVKPKEILSLKKFVRSSEFYDKNKKQKLNIYELINFFSDYYVVFLVKKSNNKTECIYVAPGSVVYN
mgnify:CR=1 FL=1